MTLTAYADGACGFAVTSETITAESAELGAWEETGYLNTLGHFLDEAWPWDFADLADEFRHRRWEGDGSDVPRWITTTSERPQCGQVLKRLEQH